MKKLLFSFSFILLCVLVTNAQKKTFLFGAANISNVKYTINGSKQDRSFRLGFQAGIGVERNITDKIVVTPTLSYSQKGAINYDVPGSNLKGKTALNYAQLTLPVSFSISESFVSVFAGAGPFLGYGISGKYSLTDLDDNTTHTKLELGNSDTDHFKAMDYGYSIMLGVTFSGRIRMYAQWDNGLANINPERYTGVIKTRNFSVAMGISF